MMPVLFYITSHILVNVKLKLKNHTIRANTDNISNHQKKIEKTVRELFTVLHPLALVLHQH
jgi:hypothetical protein